MGIIFDKGYIVEHKRGMQGVGIDRRARDYQYREHKEADQPGPCFGAIRSLIVTCGDVRRD